MPAIKCVPAPCGKGRHENNNLRSQSEICAKVLIPVAWIALTTRRLVQAIFRGGAAAPKPPIPVQPGFQLNKARQPQLLNRCVCPALESHVRIHVDLLPLVPSPYPSHIS